MTSTCELREVWIAPPEDAGPLAVDRFRRACMGLAVFFLRLGEIEVIVSRTGGPGSLLRERHSHDDLNRSLVG